MKKKLLIIAMSATLLTACNSTGGMSNTAIGGLGGAAVGAGAGTLFGGNDLKNAGLGALAGAAVGAGIGYYMDSQEKEMQQSLQGTGVQVQRTAENTISLTMPESVTFATGKSTLTPQAQAALNTVRNVLNQYPESTIMVTGHTDDVGSDSNNQTLSNQRATSVANYLAQQGVNPARLNKQGMGESQPKVPNTSDANRAQNRRVELAIVANNNAGAQQQPQQQPQQQQQGYPQQQQGYPQQQQGYPQQQQGYPQQQQGYPQQQQGYPQQQQGYPQQQQGYPQQQQGYPQQQQGYPQY